MSEQKAVIISVTPLGSYNFQDKTNYKFGIIYNGSPDMWEYHTSKSSQTEFVVGQEATFTTEVKQNGQYTNRKIKPVKPQQQSSGPGFKKPFGGGGKTPEQEKLITLQSIFSSLCNLNAQSQTRDVTQLTKDMYLVFDAMMKTAYTQHPSEKKAEGVAPAPQPQQVQHAQPLVQQQQYVAPQPMAPNHGFEEPSDLPF